MRIEFKARVSGREVVFSEEVKSDVEAFEWLHHMENLWGSGERAVKTDDEGNSKWSQKTRLSVRACKDAKGKEIKYYEFICTDDNEFLKGAKLTMGQTDNGVLYPRIKDTESGEYLPDKGWKRWDRELKKEV